MLQVYTGTGKGKTTAALGVALRAYGYGMRTLMISFLKDDPAYGEAKAALKMPFLIVKQVGRDAFVNFANPDPIDIQMCLDGWNFAKKAITNHDADIIILDEANIAAAFKLLSVEEMTAFFKEHKNNVEIILTGRSAPEEFIKIADLVTDMREVKHYFHKGVASRNGIDH